MGDTSPCLYSKRKERWRMRGGVEEVGQDGVSSWSKRSLGRRAAVGLSAQGERSILETMRVTLLWRSKR